MTSSNPAENSRYTEQERGHWRLAAHGFRWTTLGVGLMALAVVLLIVMFSVQAAITAPRNAGAARGVLGTMGIFIEVLSFGSLGCSLLSFFAVLIGLAICCFTPQPSIAKFFALGSLAMLIMSHVSFGQGLMLHLNFMQRSVGMGGHGMFLELLAGLSTYYLTALAEYYLSIVLGCCFMLAVAAEFRQQELIRGTQTFLKMFFAIPVILIALGVSISITSNFSNQTNSFLPIAGVAFVGVIYLWMAYCLIKLLKETHRTIQAEIDPQEWNRKLPVAAPIVIDPLAD